jgi:TonB family protein
MKTLARFSACLAISMCMSLPVHVPPAMSDRLQQDSPGDTLNSKSRPTYIPRKDNTFRLLPRYDHEKDTAGFKLLPKHYDDPDSDAADFVPVENEPQIVKKVEPAYPEPAMRAGFEGNVIVKMRIDKEGKVNQVVVLKSDAAIFNEPAIEAAKQFIFTPAHVKNEPVAVWVSYPFHFRLPHTK